MSSRCRTQEVLIRGTQMRRAFLTSTRTFTRKSLRLRRPIRPHFRLSAFERLKVLK
jgi:hypothetical protein